MNINEAQLRAVREDFSFARDKKILIYGTGIVAHRILQALERFQIVGCLDRFKVDGNIEGIPIITWGDVHEDSADILIIAAAQRNCREIYERIFYRCNGLHLEIYGPHGLNFKETFFSRATSVATARYYQKNKDELKGEIELHDAISFDLFDTLIMRRTLEPVDIFDLVDERIREKGILIPEFKKKRQAAEWKVPEGNIYQIYETLGNMLELDNDICKEILEEEIRCEKDCIIPRIAMVEMFHYAITLGKKVSILTDMYLPSSIIEDILTGVGIKGYDRLYVSCEHGAVKQNGLFKIYLQTVPNLNCLHIGDNKQADIEAAEQNGIDAYYVKSAYEMLKISNFRECLFYVNRKGDRAWMGLLISELFNDPFALHQSAGVATITNIEMFGKVFIAPIVAAYMQNLYDTLKTQKYDGVLFAARDGYLFRKIYDSGIMGEPKVPSIYFLTSRKLAFKSTMRTERDVEEFTQYIQKITNQYTTKSTEDALADIFGSKCISLDTLLSESTKTYENYLIYLKTVGIDLNKKYLICDLYARGTSQNALNKIMNKEQDGFYLQLVDSDYNLTTITLYNQQEWDRFISDVNLLEIILTAPMPSVCDIEGDGSPIYAPEDRNPEALQASSEAQKGIECIIDQYYTLYKKPEHINKELAGVIFALRQYTDFKEGASLLQHLAITDNLPGVQFAIQIGDEQ